MYKNKDHIVLTYTRVAQYMLQVNMLDWLSCKDSLAKEPYHKTPSWRKQMHAETRQDECEFWDASMQDVIKWLPWELRNVIKINPSKISYKEKEEDNFEKNLDWLDLNASSS